MANNDVGSTTQSGDILQRSKGVTYRKYMTSMPHSWNVHKDVEKEALEIYTKLADGFYEIRGNATGDGYEFVTAMAESFPVDVTGQYAGNPVYNVPSTASAGYAFSVRLNRAAVWEDGTPITADDYIYSYRELINPLMKNELASEVYTGRFVLANAEKYFNQGESYRAVATSEGYREVRNEDMYFSMLQPVFFFGSAAKDYYSNNEYKDKFIVDGIDLFEKYKYSAYISLTDEAIEDLNSLAAAFGDYNEQAYKEFCFTRELNAEVSFDAVGIKKIGDYELHFILDSSISEFFLKYMLTTNFLVHKDTYENAKREENGLLYSDYMTSIKTTKSYGAYKLTELIDDKLIVLEQNLNWYGWKSKDYEWKGNYEKIRINILDVTESAIDIFLNGGLDEVTLGTQSKEFYSSDFLVRQEEPNIWNLCFYTNIEGLKKQQAEGYSKAILAYENFRKGIALGIDKEYIANKLFPSAQAASVLISDVYVSDVETGELYRNTSFAKQVEADSQNMDADTRLQLSIELINSAYDEAVKNGDYIPGDIIELKYPTYADDEVSKLIVDTLETGILNVLKGTKLEGKLEISTILTDDLDKCMRSGRCHVIFNSMEGGTMDAVSCLEFLVSSERNYGSDLGELTIEFAVGDKNLSMSLQQWLNELNFGKYSSVDKDTKSYILAKLEKAVLDKFAIVPVMKSYKISLYSKRMYRQYPTYIPIVGTGEVYFSMTDKEWAAYVEEKGGRLDYS